MKNSLKTKFLFMLIGLVVLVLFSFASLALRDFERDKIAYVFDTLLSHTKSTSVQVRTDIDNALKKGKFYMRGFNSKKMNLHPYSQALFKTDESISFIYLFTYNPNDGKLVQKQKLTKPDIKEDIAKINFQSLVEKSFTSELSLQITDTEKIRWILSLKYDNISNNNSPVFLVLGLNQGNFTENFVVSDLQDTYLVDEKDRVIAQPSQSIYDLNPTSMEGLFSKIWNKIPSYQGVTEIEYRKKEHWLVSKSEVGLANLRVVSFVDKSSALETLKYLQYKTMLFLIFLVCITIIVSLYAAGSLTSNLRKLTDATKRISEGIFDINIKIKSKDEMGQLAQNFNVMASEIQRLLEETAEKSRMENELKTAKLVQNTLFPEGDFKNDDLEIVGHYEPASECGGDWWYHSHNNGKSYLWIGDATGHGAPAALVTAAAKSASTIIERMPDIEPAEIAAVLNSAIYGTAKSEVLMTFFIAVYDPKARKLEYTNASHDPPLLFPKKEGPIKKKDLITLNEEIGPRLGQDPNATYKTCSLDINVGDQIVFYTDGVTELKNSENVMLGERQFIRGLIGSFNEESRTVVEAKQDLQKVIEDFRQGHPLEDDVTFFMTRFH